MHDSVTWHELPEAPADVTLRWVASTLRHLRLHDLADTVDAGDLSGAQVRCSALGLGLQAAALLRVAQGCPQP